MGKGSNRRQAQVSDEEMARRWSDTFGRKARFVYEDDDSSKYRDAGPIYPASHPINKLLKTRG